MRPRSLSGATGPQERKCACPSSAGSTLSGIGPLKSRDMRLQWRRVGVYVLSDPVTRRPRCNRSQRHSSGSRPAAHRPRTRPAPPELRAVPNPVPRSRKKTEAPGIGTPEWSMTSTSRVTRSCATAVAATATSSAGLQVPEQTAATHSRREDRCARLRGLPFVLRCLFNAKRPPEPNPERPSRIGPVESRVGTLEVRVDRIEQVVDYAV